MATKIAVLYSRFTTSVQISATTGGTDAKSVPYIEVLGGQIQMCSVSKWLLLIPTAINTFFFLLLINILSLEKVHMTTISKWSMSLGRLFCCLSSSVGLPVSVVKGAV